MLQVPPTASGARGSFNNRMSQIYSRSQQSTTYQESNRASDTVEVPIFLSPPPHVAESRRGIAQPFAPITTRPNPQPLNIATANIYAESVNKFNNRVSSVYSASPAHQHVDTFDEQNHLEAAESVEGGFEDHASQSSSSHSDTQRLVVQPRRRRRLPRESLRTRIDGKRKLSVAFGITLFAAVLTYVILAATRTAQGLMFHILSVLFILALAGMFLHSIIRLIMLQRKRKARQARHAQPNWHGSSQRSGSTSSSSRSTSQTGSRANSDNGEMVEKPIAIVVGGDEVVTTTPKGKNKKVIRPPPPVYGNFRQSKRMNPDMVYWQKQEPSPTTPTYDEAMKDVQQAVGLQPPLYISPRREQNLQANPQQGADN